MTTTPINPDEWTTASEAARLLGVSHQRVLTMANVDGSLDIIRPWPHVTLIGRASISRWQTGARQARITTAEVRRFVLARTDCGDVRTLNTSDLEGWVQAFIDEQRPRWSKAKRSEWAQSMARRLYNVTAVA